jgi:hypothetical protein
LAVRIVPPAFDRSRRKKRTRRLVSRHDRLDGRESGYGSRVQVGRTPLVPEGFEVAEKKEAEYRLNPEAVALHVDWRVLRGDEDPALARAARTGARTAQAKEEEAGREIQWDDVDSDR